MKLVYMCKVDKIDKVKTKDGNILDCVFTDTSMSFFTGADFWKVGDDLKIVVDNVKVYRGDKKTAN